MLKTWIACLHKSLNVGMSIVLSDENKSVHNSEIWLEKAINFH